MLEQFSSEIIETLFDTLPLDVTFIDESDTVRYYSRGEDRIFKRTPEVIGKKVQNCHPQQSVHKVNQILADLKSGKRDVAEFWFDLKGRKIFVRYFAVKNKTGRYIGTLEVSQDITEIQKITGENRR